MSDLTLVFAVLNRLWDVPVDRPYELVSATQLGDRLVESLRANGVEVVWIDPLRQWGVKVRSDPPAYFPMRTDSRLPPGTFILQPYET